jgi:hypothetical protein
MEGRPKMMQKEQGQLQMTKDQTIQIIQKVIMEKLCQISIQ